jgi:6-phosphofructokinase
MIKRIIDQEMNAISAPATIDSDVEERDAALRLATAVLMVDVAGRTSASRAQVAAVKVENRAMG